MWALWCCRNLVCVYSKKHINDEPELVDMKRKANARSLKELTLLLRCSFMYSSCYHESQDRRVLIKMALIFQYFQSGCTFRQMLNQNDPRSMLAHTSWFWHHGFGLLEWAHLHDSVETKCSLRSFTVWFFHSLEELGLWALRLLQIQYP